MMRLFPRLSDAMNRLAALGRYAAWTSAILLLGAGVSKGAPDSQPHAPPPGFSMNEELYFESYLTSMAAIPSESYLVVGTSEGLLMSYPTDGSGGLEVITSLEVHNSPESGILSLAFHEAYPDQPYLYAFVDQPIADGVELAVWRMEIAKEGDEWRVHAREKIIQFPDSTPDNFYHNGGGMVMSGGVLYVARGDDFSATNSQQPTLKEGKIHRFDSEGAPMRGVGSQPPSSIYAMGIRNVFRMYADGSGNVFFADIGSSNEEELNLLKEEANYGWPFYEGNQMIEQNALGASYAPPVFALPHPRSGAATMSAVCLMDGVLPSDESGFPKRWQRRHLLGDWNYESGQLFTLRTDDDGRVLRAELFASTDRPVTDLDVSNGAVWFTTTFFDPASFGTKRSQIWSIRYTAEPGTMASVLDAMLESVPSTSVGDDTNSDGLVDAADLVHSP